MHKAIFINAHIIFYQNHMYFGVSKNGEKWCKPIFITYKTITVVDRPGVWSIGVIENIHLTLAISSRFRTVDSIFHTDDNHMSDDAWVLLPYDRNVIK